MLLLLIAAMLIIAASSAYSAAVLFEDDFTGIPDGSDAPKWDLVSGNFKVWGEAYLPGGGTSDWTENIAVPKGLLFDWYVMTALVQTDVSDKLLWSVRVHEVDPNNFFRVYFVKVENRMYWQAVVNGVWIFDPPRYSVSMPDLNWQTMDLTVVMDWTGATATLSDGTNSYTTMLPDAEIPVELKGPASVGLARTTWDPSTIQFDNLVISEIPEPSGILALVSGITALSGLGLRRRRS